MINYINGKFICDCNKKYLINEFFGVEVIYLGKRDNGEFFLYAYFDQNQSTYRYFAFDNIESKVFFEKINKIPGIGPLTAYQISFIPKSHLSKAIEEFDVKFFQAIKGVGPKSAKRLLVELKASVCDTDLKKLDIDDKLYKDIVSALKGYGYETKKIKANLENCPIALEKPNLGEIIKRLIEKM